MVVDPPTEKAPLLPRGLLEVALVLSPRLAKRLVKDDVGCCAGALEKAPLVPSPAADAGAGRAPTAAAVLAASELLAELLPAVNCCNHSAVMGRVTLRGSTLGKSVLVGAREILTDIPAAPPPVADAPPPT